MRTTYFLWLTAFCGLTACVDNKYNFSDLDTGDITLGQEWVAPLGKVEIQLADVVDFDKIGATKDEQGNYEKLYTHDKRIDINTNGNLPGIPIPLPGVTFLTSDLDGLFDGSFVLGLTNPHVILSCGDLEGSGHLDASLEILTVKGSEQKASTSNVTLTAAQPRAWIGPFEPTSGGYAFTKNTELPELIDWVPDELRLSATATPVGVLSATSVQYVVALPFVPSDKFRATTVERFRDAFDSDFVDKVFSSGSTSIFGTIVNELALDLSIKMYIVSSNDKRLPIDLPAQKVSGSGAQSVNFTIAEKDMPLMKDARHIDLDMSFVGRPDNQAYLNEKQKMSMELKLKMSGGIKL